jgi:hypothetical protein
MELLFRFDGCGLQEFCVHFSEGIVTTGLPHCFSEHKLYLIVWISKKQHRFRMRVDLPCAKSTGKTSSNSQPSRTHSPGQICNAKGLQELQPSSGADCSVAAQSCSLVPASVVLVSARYKTNNTSNYGLLASKPLSHDKGKVHQNNIYRHRSVARQVLYN